MLAFGGGNVSTSFSRGNGAGLGGSLIVTSLPGGSTNRFWKLLELILRRSIGTVRRESLRAAMHSLGALNTSFFEIFGPGGYERADGYLVVSPSPTL